MKAVSTPVVAIVLCAFGLLGVVGSAAGQCVPDLPTGSALQPQPAGDDSHGPGTQALRPALHLFLRFPFLAVAGWSLPQPQIGPQRTGPLVVQASRRGSSGKMIGRTVVTRAR